VNPLHLTTLFAVVIATAASLVTALHAIEGIVWAVACRVLGVLPDNRSESDAPGGRKLGP
jgi:hypothetical protein